jgi:methionine-rich copper-binding protein CopC
MAMTSLPIRKSLLAVVLTMLALSPAFGHAHLSQSAPAAGATVSAPSELMLIFSEPLEAAFSTLELRDAAGKPVETGKAQIKDNVMRLKLNALSAGRYNVKWHVLSVDTHKTEGTFSFTVKP